MEGGALRRRARERQATTASLPPARLHLLFSSGACLRLVPTMSVPIIFLSHSSHDREVAVSLKEVLATHTQGQIEWWLSSDGQSIRGGKNWRAEVEKALRQCSLIFILFTASSQNSAWVQFEAGFAEALGKDIVPIALPGFDVDGIPGPPPT